MVQRAVRDSLQHRSIKQIEQEGEITIVHDGIREPTLHHAPSGGNRDHILPGNQKYLEGDKIPRRASARTTGNEAGQGEGEDEFRFFLTREEFLELFLEDLELPEMAKKRLVAAESKAIQRAGYMVSGSPSAISLSRTMRNSLSRRIALRRPKSADMEQLEREIERLRALDGGDQEPEIRALQAEWQRLEKRRRLVSYIDPLDLRYRRYEPVPKPIAQAVMFCLMDVSGSMSEHMKDLAKRFFALLHLFLTRRYHHVDVVFIRHTDRAEEVDETTFFYSRETGGTLVSAALDTMISVMRARYQPKDWNIYVAQASDGDNLSSDNPKTVALMKDAILPASQYIAYLEVGREEDPMAGGAMARPTDLWRAYSALTAEAQGRFVMRRVHHRREIYPVFRELFQKRGAGERVKP